MKQRIKDMVICTFISYAIVLFVSNNIKVHTTNEPTTTNMYTMEETTSIVVTTEYTEEPTTEEPINESLINEEELDLLAHLIFAEAGSDWCEDEMLYGVGSVVLNRMTSEYFPDTMYEVIYQKGQYACTWDGNIEKEPNERAYKIAEDLLRNGSVLPANVIFQAEFKQGDGVHSKVQNMYFCYKNE